MGLLEELAAVRQRLEEENFSTPDLVKELEAIAQLHHDNALALYESENYEQYKKYWVNMLMGLSSLMDMLFGDAESIDIKETLFPIVVLTYFLKQAHSSLRTENGVKIAESITLLLSRVLKQLNGQKVDNKTDARSFLDVLLSVLTGVETYKRKSFRQNYIIPEVNRLLQRVLESCTLMISSGELKLNDRLYNDLTTVFKLTHSLLVYEVNAYAIIGPHVLGLTNAVKAAISKAPAVSKQVTNGDSKKVKTEKGQPQPTEQCNHQFTKPDFDAAGALVELVTQGMPALDTQNVAYPYRSCQS
jgi:hypothetical protein